MLLFLRSGARQSLFKGRSECYHCRTKSIEAAESRSRSFSFQNRGTDSQHRLRRCEQLRGRGRQSLRLSLQPHWRCRRARQLRRVTITYSSSSSSSSFFSVFFCVLVSLTPLICLEPASALPLKRRSPQTSRASFAQMYLGLFTRHA